MNPIPTTNAMKPAPGKGVSSFPTPVIKDTVIVEVVNAWKGDYQPLEYGTKWDDVPHASVQGSYPDHKLISQAPNSEDGQWVKRIWANDRVDQDTYNYAIKYSGGSDAHPIYIRTYVELRETYAPVPDLSPDPLFPNAKLVEEEVQREDGELDSRYVKVIRTYETLPGPIISSQRVNERGDLETIEVQEVAPSTSPDPDGLLVTQTQVIKEDVSKGTKTTATVESYAQLLIKEKKEGLLGETITTDDIVDPSTQPDELSQSIVASVVQQTSATKAVKRTTTASGPTSLSKRSNDGKLFGNVTSTQSVVSPLTTPDAPSNSILSSEVSQVDSGKAIKTNVVLVSTPTLQGEDKKPGLLGTTTATETVVPAGTSADALSQTIVSSTVEPIDSVRSRKVTVESSGPTQLTGKRINQRGDIETISESIVPAGTNAGPDGLLVISSEVEPIDSAKSKLTNTTVDAHATLGGGQSKSGLLGSTFISESIVSPNTISDSLTFNGSGGIIESSVTPISSTKSKKTTVYASGSRITSESLVDSPTGLVNAEIAKEIVAKSDKPVGSLNIIKDDIQPLDSVKSEREKITVSNWPVIFGVDYDEQLGIGIPYTEQVVSPLEYINSSTWQERENKNFKPLDQWKSVKREIIKEQVGEALLEQWYKIATDVNVTLPDVLKEVTIYWGRSGGAGKSFSLDSGASTGSYNVSGSGSSKKTASISGDVYFNVVKGYSGVVPGFQHIFFSEIANGKISDQDILSVLNNFEKTGERGMQNFQNETVDSSGPFYKRWPYVKTRSENIVLISGGKSETSNNSQSQSVNINGFSSATGQGTSIDVDVNARSINVPQVMHGPIEIKENFFGNFNCDLEPTHFFEPKILEQTDIVGSDVEFYDSFPTGKYLYSSNVELYKYGFVKVTAITVEITSEYV